MIKYVLRTWINGSFPPSTWAMFDHKGITTNNHSEGYNYRLGNNRTIEKHPNCYRWAETVREELRNSENEAIMAKCGNPNTRRRLSIYNHSQFIGINFSTHQLVFTFIRFCQLSNFIFAFLHISNIILAFLPISYLPIFVSPGRSSYMVYDTYMCLYDKIYCNVK